MRKSLKFKIIFIVLGVIILCSGTAFAFSILAPDVGFTPKDSEWDVDNVKTAIDDLYDKVNSVAFKKFCTYVSNTYSKNKNDRLSVGTKYECDPGDGVNRYFYILSVNNDNTLDLLMDFTLERGTSYKTMNFHNAMNYFTNSSIAEGHGVAIKNSWVNVLNVDLPKAQAILDVLKPGTYITNMTVSNWFCFKSGKQDYGSSQNYCATTSSTYEFSWLFNNTRACVSYGCESNGGSDTAYSYWTRDMTKDSEPTHAWIVANIGAYFGTPITITTDEGVRPVITVFKSNLR